MTIEKQQLERQQRRQKLEKVCIPPPRLPSTTSVNISVTEPTVTENKSATTGCTTMHVPTTTSNQSAASVTFTRSAASMSTPIIDGMCLEGEAYPSPFTAGLFDRWPFDPSIYDQVLVDQVLEDDQVLEEDRVMGEDQVLETCGDLIDSTVDPLEEGEWRGEWEKGKRLESRGKGCGKEWFEGLALSGWEEKEGEKSLWGNEEEEEAKRWGVCRNKMEEGWGEVEKEGRRKEWRCGDDINMFYLNNIPYESPDETVSMETMNVVVTVEKALNVETMTDSVVCNSSSGGSLTFNSTSGNSATWLSALARIEQTCQQLSISRDPMQWTSDDVRRWAAWVSQLFNVETITTATVGQMLQSIDGRCLCLFSREEFTRRLPVVGDHLYAELELFRNAFCLKSSTFGSQRPHGTSDTHQPSINVHHTPSQLNISSSSSSSSSYSCSRTTISNTDFNTSMKSFSTSTAALAPSLSNGVQSGSSRRSTLPTHLPPSQGPTPHLNTLHLIPQFVLDATIMSPPITGTPLTSLSSLSPLSSTSSITSASSLAFSSSSYISQNSPQSALYQSSRGSSSLPSSLHSPLSSLPLHTSSSFSTLYSGRWSSELGSDSSTSSSPSSFSSIFETSLTDQYFAEMNSNGTSMSMSSSGQITGPCRQSNHLWQFLKELLQQPQLYQNSIRWIDQSKGIFKIEDSGHVARLWGDRKNRPAMNYDKLSRSIRQYYKKGIIKKTSHSKRLVYQFCPQYA